VPKIGEKEKELTSRGETQLTIAAFEKGKGGMREKRYLDYYFIAQIKKDIRDDRQKLRELESKKNLWNEAKSKANSDAFL
jgi:hypothetical protein